VEDISKAQTQYDDLTGTVAIDGRDGGPMALLRELAKHGDVPQGYTPLGFRVNGGGGEDVSVSLLATDANISGVTGDEITRHIASQPGFTLFEFDLSMPFKDFIQLMKRFEIVAYHRELDGKTIVLAEDS